MRAVDIERVEQTSHVLSHVRDGVWLMGSGTAAGIAIVQEDDTESGGKNGDLLQRPQRRVVADSHHQNQCRTLSVNLVVQLLPVRVHSSRSPDMPVSRNRFFLPSCGCGLHESSSACSLAGTGGPLSRGA
jgi:hypothetical protein